jgi:hypothetical protein
MGKNNVMKKVYLTTIISVSLLICSDRLLGQTTLTKLNQAELIKQLIGNWKGETGKDTTSFWDIKSNGTGIECNFKFVTKDKMIMEGKQLWRYDNKGDKFFLYSEADGMDSGTLSLWFISKNECIITAFSDISNPEKASFKLETEFKSPDMFIQKTIVSNTIVKTATFSRAKN